jgi:hypothetical protein
VHTSTRFAWLRKNNASSSSQPSQPQPYALLRAAYNLAFWVFLLPFLFGDIQYATGFAAFTIVVLVRFGINLFTNNVLKLTPDQFDRFPFRIP